MKPIISIVASAGIIIHMIWPNLKIDSITISLLIVAILPWLSMLFEDLEIPGGWKVKFKDKEGIAKRALESGIVSSSDVVNSEMYTFQIIADKDKNLALAGLRIEIEKILIELAKIAGLETKMQGVGKLLQMLSEKNMIGLEEKSVLNDMIVLLNDAVHGKRIDHDSFIWAMDYGVRILNTLEQRFKEEKQKKSEV